MPQRPEPEQTQPESSDTTPRHAGRPRLYLSDNEARSLVLQLGAIHARHANSPRQHRPFVHDFIRAVYHATGKTYSAAFYRKLLAAYAPDRTPSTPTIETEKNLLEHDLRRRAVPDDPVRHERDSAQPGAIPIVNPASHSAIGTANRAPVGQVAPAAGRAGSDLAQVQIIDLLHHLASRFDQLERATPADDRAPGLQAYNDYLRARLVSVEDALLQAQAQVASLATAAREHAVVADERGRQLETLHQAAAAQTAALAAMRVSLDGDRQFFAMQVDGVRGETRAVRERCAQLEQLVKDKEQQVEMYRQMAYSKGPAPR